MAKPIYDTALGEYNPSSKYRVSYHYADAMDLAKPSFLGAEGVGQERFDKGVRPEDVEYLEQLRGIRQSGIGQFGNMFMQTLAEVTGGTIEGLGYLGEIGNIGDMIRGTEEEFGNALSEFGKSIKEQSREAFPIYTDYKPGSFSPGNWSWWMSHAPSIASTISLMVPSGMATGVVATLAKASGAFSKLSRTGKIFGRGVTQAVFSRHMENMMEATQSFDEIYQKNIDNGMTEADARRNAATGASSVYRRNWAMLVQDIPQYILLAGGYRGLRLQADDIAAASRAAGKSVLPVRTKQGLNIFKDMLGEGVEELYQHVVQREAEYLAQRALDPNIESAFGDRMYEYIRDGDMWTAGWFGMMGAGAMQAMRGVNQKLTKARLRERDVSSWGASTSQLYKNVMAAIETGNPHLVTGARDAGLGNLLTSSAIHENLGKFREFVESISAEDVTPEKLAELNLTKEDAADIAINKEELLQDINRFEEIWKDNMEKFTNKEHKSYDLAAMAARTEFLIEKVQSRRLASQNRMDELTTRIANFDKLSPHGQEIIKLQAENKSKRGLVKYIKRLANEEENEFLSESRKLAANAIEQEIEDNKARISDLRELRTPEETVSDKKVRVTSKALSELDKEQQNLDSLDQVLSDLQDSLELIEKGEMPFKKSPRVTPEEEVEADVTKPQVGDGVVYTNPETNVGTLAKVLKIENDSDYTIQLYDNEGNELKDRDGNVIKPVKVTVESLEKILDSTDTDENTIPTDPEPEPEPEEEEPTKPEEELGKAIEPIGVGTLKWRQGIQKESGLNEVVSDPNLSAEDKAAARISFSINDTYEEFWKDHKDLQKKIEKGPLSAERIEKVLTSNERDIPIEVYIYLKEKLYAGDIFVSLKDRQVRAEILRILLSGNKAIAKGLDNNDIGWRNNIKGFSGNVAEAWNQPLEEIQGAILDQDNVINFGSGNVRPDLKPGKARKGSIFGYTNRTPNGESVLVQLNRVKVSKEHAEILWEAFRQAYHKDKGFKAPMNHPKVEGLTVGETISLLGFVKERVETELEEYQKDQQLFVKRNPELGYMEMHYGRKVLPIMSNQLVKEMKESFIEWATTYLNYPSYIKDDILGQTGFNEVWTKKFKVGSLEHNGDMTPFQIMVTNDLVTTDVKEYVPGSIMEGPNLRFGNVKQEAEKPKPTKAEQEKIKKGDPLDDKDVMEGIIEEGIPDDLDDISLFDKDDTMLRAWHSRPIKVQNLKRELKVVRRMLGKKVADDVEEVDRIIKVVKTGRKGWATYSHDAIKLYNAAEIGTLYHEAFHRVSLGYFNSEERAELYDNARREFRLRGLSDMEVEEELAERFRIFVLSKGERKYPSSIRSFFAKLWNHIKNFFIGENRITQSETNKLFEAIWSGDYRRTELSADRAVLDGEVLRYMYGREFNNIDTIKQLRDMVKGLTFQLIKLNEVSDLNSDVSEIDWLKLRNHIEKTIGKLRVGIARGTDQGKIENAQRRLDLYTDILGYSEVTQRFEGFDVMKELIRSFLSSMNIEIVQEEPDNYTDSTEEGLGIENLDKPAIESSLKENALGSVKLRVALLPKSDGVNPITGMPEFVDYNEAWNMLLGDLYDLNNINDMIARLSELSGEENRHHYISLVQALRENKDTMFDKQFLATFRNHRHAFMNSYADYAKGYTYTFTDADVRGVANTKVNEWGFALYNSRAVNKEKETLASDFVSSVTKEHKQLADDLQKAFRQSDFADTIDIFYDRALGLLAKMGIIVDKRTLDQLVIDKNLEENRGVLSTLDGDIGRIINNTYGKFSQEDRHISKIYQHSAVNKFATAYAEAHPEEMSNMVLGPASAQYYTYTNHSVVTSLIRDIKRNPELATKLKKKRWHTRSKFLEFFENQENAKKVRVRTFAGISVRETADEGRDYMAMTPVEDYVLKLHTTVNGLVNFPTLADKKTYYFLDGMNVIQVGLEKQDDGTFLLSEDTVDRLYDHVLDERDRITKARADRINLLKEQLVENYHVVKGDTSKGRAYNFTTFNKLDYDAFDEGSARGIIREEIQRLVDRELAKAASMGVIYQQEGLWHNSRIDKNRMAKGVKDHGNTDAAIRAIFTEFVVRSIDNNIELHKLFIGDPAFYKSKDDLGKRLGSLIASGEEMALSTTKYGEYLTRPNFKVATLAEQDYVSAYYPNLLKEFSKRIGKTRAEKLLAPYKEIRNADGQTFVTADMYRSIAIRIGEWSIDKQKAFDLLQYGGKFVERKGIGFAKDFNPDLAPDGITYRIIEEDAVDLQKGEAIGEISYFNVPNSNRAYLASSLGALGIELYDNKSKGKGIGKYAFLWLGEKLKKEGKILFSGTLDAVSPEATRMFESLIKEGVVKISDNRYEYTGEVPLTIEQEAEALKVVLNPLKTVYFGFDEASDMALPIYDKMSMAPLFRRVVKGKQIEKLLDTMENKGIDMVKMDSAVKVGQRGAVPLWADKGQTTMNDLADIPIFVQQFKNLRRQQVTPIHEDERTNTGSQVLKIAMANLNKHASVYTMKGEKAKDGNEIADIINGGLGALSLYGQKEVDADLGYRDGKMCIKCLIKTMRREARKSNMPISTIDAIREVDGVPYLNWDAFPNRKWVTSKLISKVVKKVAKRKLPGGQMIQVSNLGYRNANILYDLENASEEKRIGWLKDTKDLAFIHMEDGKVAPMEAVVSINLFKSLIPNYKNLTWQQKVEYMKKQDLEILGYRIPTQGQNSTVALKIVGVLPEQSGDSIILPSEFTALTGSDFDIDKLYVMRKNYTHDADRNIKEIDYITNDDTRAYNAMLMYKFDVHKDYFSDSFKEWYRANNYERIERIDDEIDREIEEQKQHLDDATDKEQIKMHEGILEDLEARRKDLREERGIYTFDLTGLDKDERALLRSKIQEELIKLKVIQKPEDFAKLTDLEKNTPRAIENRVVEAYLSILKSPDHLLKTAAPLGGLKETLSKLSDQVRQKYEEKDIPMMDELTPKYQSEQKEKYATGKGGVGPFALHNSHHVLTQLAEYKTKGVTSSLQNSQRIPSKLNPETKVSVVDMSAITGAVDKTDILDWLSVLIDAHVDLPTDPYIIDLNINPFTYDVAGYMIRSGMGRYTFNFLSNRAIKIASEIYSNEQRSLFRRRTIRFNEVIERAKRRIAGLAGIELVEDQYRNLVLPKAVEEEYKERSKELLDNSKSRENDWLKGVKEDRDFWITQLAILDKFSKIRSLAQVLSNDLHSSQLDTANYGSSMIGLEAFFNRIKRSSRNSEDGKTFNYEKIVPYDFTELATEKKEGEIFIADYYRNGLVHMIDMFSGLTIDSTSLFRDTIEAMMNVTRNRDTFDQGLINKFGNELFAAILGHFAYRDGMTMTSESIRGLFEGENSVFNDFNRLRSDEKLAELFDTNSFLKRLSTHINVASVVPNYFVMRETEFKDSMELDDVVYSWEELLSHPDDRVSNFAKRMFYYNFYTSGMSTRIYSFNNLVPPSFMKDIYNINGVITGLLQSLNNDSIRPQMARIIDDILSHGMFSPRLRRDFGFTEVDTDQGSVYTSTDTKALGVGIRRGGDIIGHPYVVLRGETYKYQGYVPGKINKYVYTKVDARGNNRHGRYVHEYGLGEPVFEKQKVEGAIDNLTKFTDDFVKVDLLDVYFDQFDAKQEPQEADTSVAEQGADKLSRPGSPLEIFVDGSTADETADKHGYGAWTEYNGDPYFISGASVEISKFAEAFPDVKVSNPTMELLGFVTVLKKFANTGEHLRIWQDLEHISRWEGLNERAKNSAKYLEKGYKPGTLYTKYLVNEALEYIEEIEANGGSVDIRWVKGHATQAEIDAMPEVYIDQATTERLVKGNEMADEMAGSVESKDTFSDLLALRELYEEAIEIDFPGNPEEYTGHSGGAYRDNTKDRNSADTAWEDIGAEFGVKVIAHSFGGHKHGGANPLVHSKEELAEADKYLKKANESLKRTYPTSNEYVNNLLRRNWFQVKDADAIYAIGILPGNVLQTYVEGGTGWAVQMAKDIGKKIFVFNQKDNEWYEMNKKTGYFEKMITVPMLTKNFAGIGSRELTEEGRLAILQAYGETFGEEQRKYCKGS